MGCGFLWLTDFDKGILAEQFTFISKHKRLFKREKKSIAFMSKVSSEGGENIDIHGWSSQTLLHPPNFWKHQNKLNSRINASSSFGGSPPYWWSFREVSKTKQFHPILRSTLDGKCESVSRRLSQEVKVRNNCKKCGPETVRAGFTLIGWWKGSTLYKDIYRWWGGKSEGKEYW